MHTVECLQKKSSEESCGIELSFDGNNAIPDLEVIYCWLLCFHETVRKI